jgi:alkanesulfonate monooxygenase SsuD/methylene tetrahydromethanopterin reductase-like flavin-dependent oxidoreductase (luciferase family)
VALGYRDEEFDGLGLARRDRGQMMEAGLEVLHRTWEASPGQAPAQAPHPPVWMGGMAGPALERGARWGCNFLLPPTLAIHEVAGAIDRIRGAAAAAGRPMGRVGIVKDTWVDDDAERARAAFLPALADAYREYGSWWVFKGRFTGHDRPDLVERQVERSVAAALVGDPAEITTGLRELAEAGVDTVALHLNRAATRESLEDAMALVGAEVLPQFRGAAPHPTDTRC